MHRIRCYECGKAYDYDEDGFCPRCGAFNQPLKSSAIGADGSVIRADGLNERNHKSSFVHEEFHEENRERKGTALSKGVKRAAYTAVRPMRQPAREEQRKKSPKSPLSVIVWIIFAVIALNILSSILMMFRFI